MRFGATLAAFLLLSAVAGGAVADDGAPRLEPIHPFEVKNRTTLSWKEDRVLVPLDLVHSISADVGLSVDAVLAALNRWAAGERSLPVATFRSDEGSAPVIARLRLPTFELTDEPVDRPTRVGAIILIDIAAMSGAFGIDDATIETLKARLQSELSTLAAAATAQPE